MFQPDQFSVGFFHPFPAPTLFSLQDLRDEEIVQKSSLLALPDKVMVHILSFVPLRERLTTVRLVCKKLAECSKQSLKSVSFIADGLDHIDDAKISYFLSQYGSKIKSLNYDLYKSSHLKEYTQWSWRQSVILTVTKCPQLRQLEILVCARHRVRDGDLAVVFKQCRQLETLKIDGQFIFGHCFAKAPLSLQNVELECCSRITKQGFVGMCSRLFKMKSLYVSQLDCLDDICIRKISELKRLEKLAIVSDPDLNIGESDNHQFTVDKYGRTKSRFSDIRRLSHLKTLILDGLSIITDKVLNDLCDPSTSAAALSIENLSLAYCRNVGTNGIDKLKFLKKLKNLNLDGVSKRDISLGLESVAKLQLLERIFLSESTFVQPTTVIKVVAMCPKLRLIDISGNSHLLGYEFAESLYGTRNMRHDTKKLVVLTDETQMWARVPRHTSTQNIEIVYIHNCGDQVNIGAVSPNSPSQLPIGFMMPSLRSGVRFKMIKASNVDVDLSEMMYDQENSTAWEELAKLFIQLGESHDQFSLSDFNVSNQLVQNENLPPHMDNSFMNVMANKSGGAPKPPSEYMGSKAFSLAKHTRPGRSNRKSKKEPKITKNPHSNASLPTKGKSSMPSFTDDDFPPLG